MLLGISASQALCSGSSPELAARRSLLLARGLLPFPQAPSILSGLSPFVQLLPPPHWSPTLSICGHSSAPRSSPPFTLIWQYQSPNFLYTLCFVFPEPKCCCRHWGYRMNKLVWFLPCRSLHSAVEEGKEQVTKINKGVSDCEGLWQILFSSLYRSPIMILKL